MSAKKPTKPKPITATAFERELAALQRLLKAGKLKPDQYNDRYEVLLERLRFAGDC